MVAKSKVYFIPTVSADKAGTANKAADLLKYYLEQESKNLNSELGIKVHFGERGNKTFLDRAYFKDVIEYLQQQSIKPYYIETNVLYRGERTTSKDHIQLAKDHGFDDLPIVIADGDIGQDSVEVEINKKHFKKCLLGRAYSENDQFLVISHFKGHMLSGFGGAIKQLAMGFASRGGKLAQHAGAKPMLIEQRCIQCGKCVSSCPVNALKLTNKIELDKQVCIGCAACIAICPTESLNIDWGGVAVSDFREMLMEYALAAHSGKNNIYLNYAVSIAEGCDCEGREMELVADDLGILISDDPLAIDKATLDLLNQQEKKEVFDGLEALEHGEKIGLGSLSYELILPESP